MCRPWVDGNDAWPQASSLVVAHRSTVLPLLLWYTCWGSTATGPWLVSAPGAGGQEGILEAAVCPQHSHWSGRTRSEEPPRPHKELLWPSP